MANGSASRTHSPLRPDVERSLLFTGLAFIINNAIPGASQ